MSPFLTYHGKENLPNIKYTTYLWGSTNVKLKKNDEWFRLGSLEWRRLNIMKMNHYFSQEKNRFGKLNISFSNVSYMSLMF